MYRKDKAEGVPWNIPNVTVLSAAEVGEEQHTGSGQGHILPTTLSYCCCPD